jgi:hypothetical protein
MIPRAFLTVGRYLDQATVGRWKSASRIVGSYPVHRLKGELRLSVQQCVDSISPSETRGGLTKLVADHDAE